MKKLEENNKTMNYSPSLNRIAAYIVDNLLVVILIIPFSLGVGFLLGSFRIRITADMEIGIYLSMFIIVDFLNRFLLQYFTKGRSIGKLIFRIRVVGIDGSRLGAWAMFFRWLVLQIEMVIGALGVIASGIVANQSDKYQSIHDHLVDSIVIK